MMTRVLLAIIISMVIVVDIAYAANYFDKMNEAIDKNDIRTVKVLLAKKYTNPNRRRDTRASPTFLTQAARLGRVEMVSLLLAAGAGVNVGDGDDITPLMHAAWNGHKRVVGLLLDAGADINEVNKWGETALQLAKQGKHRDVIDILEKAESKKQPAANHR
ncbi:MAG: hypothetical protein GJT30_09485 [Geobacter sp.]|nr:hypothetical protein [Geobacter sp.]